MAHKLISIEEAGKLIGVGFEVSCYESKKKRSKDFQGDSEPCYLCNREIKADKIKEHIEIIGGGSAIASQAQREKIDFDHSGYMGCFPVGSYCKKKLPQEAIIVFED